MTSFTISPQSPAPHALDNLLDICFGPGRRARTAERLREHNQPIAAYTHSAYASADASADKSYSAETLIGAISFWPLHIDEKAGLLLGPLAVHPDMQGQGLGLALMQVALDTIDTARFPIVLLVGDLPYYERAGFRLAPPTLALPGPVNPQRLLVRGDAALCDTLTGMVRPAPELC